MTNQEWLDAFHADNPHVSLTLEQVAKIRATKLLYAEYSVLKDWDDDFGYEPTDKELQPYMELMQLVERECNRQFDMFDMSRLTEIRFYPANDLVRFVFGRKLWEFSIDNVDSELVFNALAVIYPDVPTTII